MMRTMPLTILLSLVALGFAASASACLWESDTLRQESEGIEDVVSIVLGAFPRNPDLYYEMRLSRAEAAIKADATNWEAYDDAGVSSDRLGQSDRAIAFMESKRAAMDAAGYDGATIAQPNHSYRYKANLGTFYVHRWFRKGKDFSQLDDINRAVGLIRAAIQENPDAHFGREKYQLQILEWLASDPRKITPEFYESGNPALRYPNWLEAVPSRWQELSASPEEQKAMLLGLAGLMKLGAAWQSLDVLRCMEMIAAIGDKTQLMRLIAQRISELRGQGVEGILAWSPTPEDLAHGANPQGDRFIMDVRAKSDGGGDAKREFAQGRAAVERCHKARLSFMLAKLRQGQHPDTQPGFWEGFANPEGFVVRFDDEGEVADVTSSAPESADQEEDNFPLMYLLFGIPVGLVVLGIALFLTFGVMARRARGHLS